jgi:hypothetical protein
VTDLVPPGHQPALFTFPTGREQYRVLDRTGVARLTTAALGIALVVAQRVASEDGEAWITSPDGAAARLDGEGGIATATPRPWIDTITHAHHGGTPT